MKMNNLRLFQGHFPMVGMHVRALSNKTAVLSKIHRLVYARMYPTLLVYPNGSTITIRHSEPRGVIRLPLDLETLSDEEKRDRLERRKPKQKVVIEEDIADSFSVNKYVKFIKKKK